ncbi:MAG TPA: antitoxin [Candidatus Wunengus sp. YC65]|uniref:antitoxin n=1 Tax=Candidatus Wunengus sp. YC65 TaxID=3367701 RepID=UPI004028B705
MKPNKLLPKEFRFKGDHVFIKKEGNRVIRIPEKKTWDTLIRSLKKFTDDFIGERTQPETQKREELFGEVHA